MGESVAADGRCTDDENRPDYEAAGFGPFAYTARRSGKTAAMPYSEVPDGVLEDADALVEWAHKASEAALRADRAKPASARKSGRVKKRKKAAG